MLKLVKDLLAFVMAVVELLLVTRFLIKLLGGNPQTPFIAWVYDMTQPLLQPFLLAFPTPSIKGGFVLEFTTLFAIFAYAFFGYLLEQLIEIISSRTETLHKKR